MKYKTVNMWNYKDYTANICVSDIFSLNNTKTSNFSIVEQFLYIGSFT